MPAPTEQQDTDQTSPQGRAPGRPDIRSTRRQKLRATALAATVAAAAGATVLALGVLTTHQSEQRVPAPTKIHDRVLVTGPAAASDVIDIYAEYGCRSCGPVLEQLSGPLADARANGTARVRYHLTATTPSAAVVANAVACVSDTRPDLAVDYYLSLLPYPTGRPNATSLVEDADRLGVNGPQVTSCITSGHYDEWVEKNTRPAGSAEKPLLLLNGDRATPADVAAVLTDTD